MAPLNQLTSQAPGEGLASLRGITVLDLSTSVAGPYGTQLLADLGAEVIKVEKRDGGDDTRAWGPPFLDGESLWFLSVNRNKRSVAIDLNQPEGRALLHRLVPTVDVVVLNVAERIQKKLGLDYATLAALNPSLIHASLTGFGLHGPRADLPCYDLIAEGHSSVMDLTGEADSPPQKVGTPAADLLAGHDLALAVLAALHERQRSGAGKRIDVSMLASMVRFMSPRIVPYLGSGQSMTRSGGRDSVIAIYQVFDTADHPITLGLGNDAIWQRFWAAVERPDYGARAEFRSNALRLNARERIVVVIADLLAAHPRAHWLALFEQHRIPSGPINSLAQLAEDPLLRDEGLLFSVQGPAGPLPQVGLGIRFDGSSAVYRSAPPRLGEHTESVLHARLGLPESALERLRQQGVIG
ncbi:MAG: CaiB/BaiF CoA transferase family protein [Burkholderiaceae bacterium]